MPITNTLGITPTLVQSFSDAYVFGHTLEFLAAGWGVGFLFLFVMFPQTDVQRKQTALLVIMVALAPVFVLNVVWWAVSVYIMYTFFAVIVSLHSLVS